MEDHRDDFDRWLLDAGARSTSVAALQNGYCRFLNRRGFKIRRCNFGGQTIHPLMNHTRTIWSDRAATPTYLDPTNIVSRRQYRFGEAMIDEMHFIGDVGGPTYANSPFGRLDREGDFAIAIAPAGEPQPYPIFDDLAALGCTGYYAYGFDEYSGLRRRAAFATDRPGGYSDEQVEYLRYHLPRLGLVLRALGESEIKQTLARVYLGTDPGNRVCGGMITRGDIISVEAAIWFSDLRGFTARSDDLDPQDLLRDLNAYFDCIGGAIYDVGGEVLKYIGDAVLAVFTTRAFGDRHAACAAAADAAAQASTALEDLNFDRAERGEAAIEHGVALHVGEVHYGNIGSRERLDFTVIGREVNIASRIEGLCKTLGETMLCSAAFATEAPRPFRSVGSHAVKGVRDPIELFVPR